MEQGPNSESGKGTKKTTKVSSILKLMDFLSYSRSNSNICEFPAYISFIKDFFNILKPQIFLVKHNSMKWLSILAFITDLFSLPIQIV